MQDKAREIKMFFTALGTAFTTLFGWYGWMFLIWLLLLFVDWLTGSAAAKKTGDWSSTVAKEKNWKKCASLAVVAVACALDVLIGILANHVGAFTLPFSYGVAFAPIVTLWYIFTECGSIIENAGKLGAPIPMFLQKSIAMFKAKIEQEQDDNNNNDEEC